MAVPQEYCGVPFRQITDTLRWRRNGKRVVSRRPIDEANTHYTDSPEDPTLVTFEPDDERVDVVMLLRQRAIAPWASPESEVFFHRDRPVDITDSVGPRAILPEPDWAIEDQAEEALANELPEAKGG